MMSRGITWCNLFYEIFNKGNVFIEVEKSTVVCQLKSNRPQVGLKERQFSTGNLAQAFSYTKGLLSK